MLVLNFFLFRVIPGDPARTLGRGRLTSPEAIAEFNHTYGLDQPLWQQFFTFLKNTAQGDLGYSLRYNVPVVRADSGADGPDAAVGGFLDDPGHGDRGLSRDHRGVEPRERLRQDDQCGSALTLYSMPEWWLGLLLIEVLAVGVGPFPGIFPTGGLHSVGIATGGMSATSWTRCWHLALPVTHADARLSCPTTR